MRLAERVWRTARRSDTRAAIAVGVLLTLVIALQGVGLAAFVAIEGLEEADRWMQNALDSVRLRVSHGEAPEVAIDDLRGSLGDQKLAVRLRDADGDTTRVFGDWPPPGLEVSTQSGDDRRGLGSARLLRADRHLVGHATLPSGPRIELALGLAHFASEALELVRAIALITLVSSAAALLFAIAATSRAFSPLRQATALLEDLDSGNLGRRLPSRGTDDPIDRHAETLNEVLAEIEAAFTRLRAFSSDVAHELRTPLNRIRNVAEVSLLSRREEELRPALEVVQAAAEDVSGIVQSLLLLADLDVRRRRLQGAEIEVAPWITRIVESYDPLFEERDVALTVRNAARTIVGEQTLLDRILANLLDNALHHTVSGDRVEIRALESETGTMICVEDSGPGVPLADRERIFDRFARLDDARSGTGHGLGLTLARAIARLHGGDLSVEDSKLGGACFRLYLPVDRPSGPA